MQEYSIKKGLYKGLGFATTALVTILIVSGLSDVLIWDLIVTYIKPIVGTLTVGGLVTMASNYAKFRYKN